MSKIITNPNQIACHPDYNGDVAMGERYLFDACPFDKLKRGFCIPSVYHNPFIFFQDNYQLITNFHAVMRNTFEYRCRWTNNTYKGFVPMIFNPKNPQHLPKKEGGDPVMDMALDMDWCVKMVLRINNGIPEPGAIIRSLLGHGYADDSCTPYGGSPGLGWAALRTDDGDEIQGLYWKWYSK